MKKIILFSFLFYAGSLFGQPESILSKLVKEGKIKELETIQYQYEEGMGMKHTTSRDITKFDRKGRITNITTYFYTDNQSEILFTEKNYTYNSDGKLSVIIITDGNKKEKQTIIYTYNENRTIEKKYDPSRHEVRMAKESAIIFKDEKDRDTLTLYHDKNENLINKVRIIYDEIGLKEKIIESQENVSKEIRENDDPYIFKFNCFTDNKLTNKKRYQYDNFNLTHYSTSNADDEELFWMMPIILDGNEMIIEEEFHNNVENEVYRKRYKYTYYEDEK